MVTRGAHASCMAKWGALFALRVGSRPNLLKKTGNSISFHACHPLPMTWPIACPARSMRGSLRRSWTSWITQSKLHGRFCGKAIHASVNAARVVIHRRSVVAPFPGPAQRKRLLHDQVAAFQAAHPFVSRAACGAGRPLARGRKDDPRWENPYFRKVMPPRVSEVPTPPSVLARA